MSDSTQTAHVAKAVERLSGGEDGGYDAAADFAAVLLAEYPDVRSAAQRYDADEISEPEFDAAVRAAAAQTEWRLQP
jgi:molybdenum-dependent DNA-binding transcriptional regulator ModE